MMTKLNKQSKVEMEMERKRVRVRVEVGSETVRFLLPISVTFFPLSSGGVPLQWFFLSGSFVSSYQSSRWLGCWLV